MDRDRLPRVHVPQLSFLEVRCNPDVVERRHRQKRLAGLDAVAEFNRLMANHAADWRIDFGVTQIELSSVNIGSGLVKLALS
jgi:hypothetical protein